MHCHCGTCLLCCVLLITSSLLGLVVQATSSILIFLLVILFSFIFCNPLLLPQLPLQLGWAGEMQALLASDELAKDVEGAEALLEQHEERKQEVRNKQEK